MRFTDRELNSLYRYAYSLTHEKEWARDLVSYAVEKILLRPWVLRPHPYLKRCIRNRFFDELSRKLREEPILVEEASLESLESILINRDQVKNLLSELDPRDRELLYLWAVEEYSLSEIAKLWKTPKGTLCSRIYRLRRKLQKHSSEQINE